MLQLLKGDVALSDSDLPVCSKYAEYEWCIA